MDNKNKIFILGLGLVCVILGFISFQTTQNYSRDKKRYSEETQKLHQDNDSLNADIARAKEETKNAQKKIEAMQKEIGAVSGERSDWKNKYDQISTENEGLLVKIKDFEEKLKKQKAEGDKTAPAASEDAYWASIVKEKAGLEISLGDLDKQVESMSIRIEELTKQNNELTLEVSKVSQSKTDLERQGGYNQKLSQNLSEELVREKNDKRALLEQMDKLRQDYDLLQEQLKDATEEKILLAKEQQDIKEENKLLTRKISEMDQVLQDRMSEILKVKEQLTDIRLGANDDAPGAGSKVVELPAIVVRSGAEAASSVTQRGFLSANILAVNKENNFVVIDIGESSGVKKGMLFDVYRGDVKLGSVDVIQVKRDIAAADIKYLEHGQQMKVGDMIR